MIGMTTKCGMGCMISSNKDLCVVLVEVATHMWLLKHVYVVGFIPRLHQGVFKLSDFQMATFSTWSQCI